MLCAPPGLTLEPKGEWDTFGFRGTCSLGFHLVAEGDVKTILTDTFDIISRRTMLPVAHVLWGSVWLGTRHEAVDRARTLRARRSSQEARSHPSGSNQAGRARGDPRRR